MTEPYTIRTCAPLLGCSESKLRTFVRKKKIGHCRIGTTIVFYERHIQAFIDEREVLPRSDGREG